jgi:hypothetical protein
MDLKKKLICFLYVCDGFQICLNSLLLLYYIINYLLASMKLIANSKNPSSNPL